LIAPRGNESIYFKKGSREVYNYSTKSKSRWFHAIGFLFLCLVDSNLQKGLGKNCGVGP
jgi:hypothetical protein